MSRRIIKYLFTALLCVLASSLMAQGKLRSTCSDTTTHSIRESMAYYQKRLSLDSSDEKSYYSIAMSYFKLGDYPAAIQYYDQLEILNPEYSMLYANRGICKLLGGNKLGACNDFGLSLLRNMDPEIIDGEKISQWVERECPGHAKSAFQILSEKQVCPNFTVTGFDHSSFELEAYAGKYVVIDIWATWCSPCIKQRPKLHALQSKFGVPDEIVFISISIDKRIEIWENFLLSNPYQKSQYWAGDHQEGVPYRLTLSDGGDGRILMGVPQYLIIGPDGTILKKLHGKIDLLKKELKILKHRL